MDQYLTTRQVAQLFQIKEETVQGWVRRGVIPHMRLAPKMIRFRRQDVEAFIAAKTKH